MSRRTQVNISSRFGNQLVKPTGPTFSATTGWVTVLILPVLILLVLTGCSSTELTATSGAAQSTQPSTSTEPSPEPEPNPSEPTTTLNTPANPPADPPVNDDADAWLLNYLLPSGECIDCAFSLKFFSNGVVQHRSPFGMAAGQYDTDQLTALIDSDFDNLIIGSDDCGREVDGNDNVLSTPSDTIDFCYHEIDESTDLMLFVKETSRALSQVESPIAASYIVYGGRCINGGCWNSVEIFADGTWVTRSNESVGFGADMFGTLDQPEEFLSAVRSDTASASLGPFEGTCPLAYDGLAATYKIHADDAQTTTLLLDTCRDVVDHEHPAIAALDTVAAATLPLNLDIDG